MSQVDETTNQHKLSINPSQVLWAELAYLLRYCLAPLLLLLPGVFQVLCCLHVLAVPLAFSLHFLAPPPCSPSPPLPGKKTTELYSFMLPPCRTTFGECCFTNRALTGRPCISHFHNVCGKDTWLLLRLTEPAPRSQGLSIA